MKTIQECRAKKYWKQHILAWKVVKGTLKRSISYSYRLYNKFNAIYNNLKEIIKTKHINIISLATFVPQNNTKV